MICQLNSLNLNLSTLIMFSQCYHNCQVYNENIINEHHADDSDMTLNETKADDAKFMIDITFTNFVIFMSMLFQVHEKERFPL